MSGSCRGCGAPLAAGARFCGACGAATREHQRAVADLARHERRTTARAAAALSRSCAVPLFGLAFAAHWLAEVDGVTHSIVVFALVLATAALAAMPLGDPRAILVLRTTWGWLAAAPAVALVTLACATAFVALLPGGESRAPDRDDLGVEAWVWLAAVGFAPLAEELLCRGVAWSAAARLASARATLLITSILFGYLHGLNGGYLLEVPHRLVAGLAFGWLRWRSGSLGPPMLAHALHNAGAIWLDG
jgi:membrane protease YdiL (CAAX protease family)